jgi:hypothetical protein
VPKAPKSLAVDDGIEMTTHRTNDDGEDVIELD